MIYNLHPIIVHFPIALLFLYSLIRLLPVQRWLPRVNWLQLRQVLLVLGILGAFGALATGETAEHLVKPNRLLVEYHSAFANLTTWLYVIILLGEAAKWLKINWGSKLLAWSKVERVVHLVDKVINQRLIVFVLVLLAFLGIIMTGLLGGVIVYGTTADPLAAPILQLLGVTL